MSNKIGITDLVNRFEHDIASLLNQELNWQSRIMLNNLKDQINDLEEMLPQPRVKGIDFIFNQLRGFIATEEANLESSAIK